ncbi:hypothetical protein PQQ51_15150 [Paraburkholderia xenovorans]
MEAITYSGHAGRSVAEIQQDAFHVFTVVDLSSRQGDGYRVKLEVAA